MTAQASAGLNVRQAARDDVSLILAMIRELAEYERLSHEVIATEQRLQEALFGPQAVAEALIAELDGEPVAFALFFSSFSTFIGLPGIYLEDLFVRPAVRGHGVGRALLQRLAAIAVERGCGRLEWAVLDWNDPAIGFYRRLGAEAMSEWTVYRLASENLRRLAASSERNSSVTA